ncbi:methyl-CpG-binding domain-containing protein 5-like isoform X2 [Magnolia sinica]|uniref:methyl-CpG-binding domain-containing protein 5-like isoform X2 n=1 Tax=Magnolia sinica TaxID=86752 RepID=UPI00265B6671|nr:methyl-CpG-binding domain-containing protein 5-like isoform X2 [Magnolia sinica]
MSASETPDRKPSPIPSDPRPSESDLLAGNLTEGPSDPEPESDARASSNVPDGKAPFEAMAGKEAAAAEGEKRQAKNLFVKSESVEDRSPPTPPPPPRKDLFVEADVKLEPGLGVDSSVDRGVRTPPAAEEASEEPKRGFELAVVPSSTPDWLPPGWLTEVKVRTSGVTAGTKDKYFYDPVSRRRFRSKKEVFSFLETGKLGRYKSKTKIGESDANNMLITNTNNTPKTKTGESVANITNNTPSPSSRPRKRDRSSSKQKNASRFDFVNCPEKVRWVLSNAAEGSWKPFICGEEVPDSSKKAWGTALEYLSSGAGKFQE